MAATMLAVAVFLLAGGMPVTDVGMATVSFGITFMFSVGFLLLGGAITLLLGIKRQPKTPAPKP